MENQGIIDIGHLFEDLQVDGDKAFRGGGLRSFAFAAKRLPPGNITVVIRDNGSYEVAESIPKLSILSHGSRSLAMVHERFQVKKKGVLHLGENSLVYLARNACFDDFWADLTADDLTFYVGHDTHIIGARLYASGCNGMEVLLGPDSLFSSGITLRTTDGHTIYDLDNPAIPVNHPCVGIHVGAHVWVGQDAFLGKDAYVPHDCIVGAKALVTGRRADLKPNSILAGIPAKTIRRGVAWDKSRVDMYMHNTL